MWRHRRVFNLSLRNVPIPQADQAALKKALEESLRLLDLKLEYAQKQQFPSSSNAEYTLVHAAIRGIIRRDPERAIGTLIFPSPISLPKGAKLFTDDGREYQVNPAITSQRVAVIESILTGAGQNLPPGEVLSLFSPVGFVTGGTVSEGGIIGGTDIESIESLRLRVIDRWRQNSEYGSVKNYYEWLGQTRIIKAGVFPAYPVPGMVSWTGLVEAAGGALSLPSPEIEAEIQAFLETKRPPGARVLYLRESKITLISLTIKTQTRLGADSAALLTLTLKNLFLDRAFAKGASQFEETPPLSENLVRLTIFQFLGDSNPFELSITPPQKLGSKTLALGENLLPGGVSYV